MSNARDKHIVWDWNGTLFHDLDAVMAATNLTFDELGFDRITLEQYRTAFQMPVPEFYRQILGRVLTPDEWEVLDRVFHEHYHAHMADCGLSAGAADLLAAHVAEGGEQSLLSMYDHDKLDPLVRSFEIHQHFLRVQGRLGPSGGTKGEHLARHLKELDVDPATVVLIGDVADDARAALSVGAKAVLWTGGQQGTAGLKKAGVPVVDSLEEAVALALR